MDKLEKLVEVKPKLKAEVEKVRCCNCFARKVICKSQCCNYYVKGIIFERAILRPARTFARWISN